MTSPNSQNETIECARPGLRRRTATVLACAAVFGLAALGIDHVVDAIGSGGDRHADLASSDSRRQPGQDSSFAHQVLADEWNDRISTDTFWRNRRPGSGSSNLSTSKNKPNRLQGPQPEPGWFLAPAPSYWGQPPQAQPVPRSSPRTQSGYRTVCVRLCDGFFFPISFGASEGSLGRDQTSCSNSCPGARLYYGKAGDDETDDMIDLNGQRYSKLPNANLFRTQYSESCKCRPHSWEQAAMDRHRIFALEDQRRKGNRNVMVELEELKSKQLIDRRIKGRRESSRSPAVLETRTVALGEAQTAPRSDVSRGQSGGERPVPTGVVTGTLTAAVSVVQQRSALSSAVAAAQSDGTIDGHIAAVHVPPSSGLSTTDRAMVVALVPAPGEMELSETRSAQATRDVNQAPPSEAQPDTTAVKPAVVPAKLSGKRGKDRQRQAQVTRPGGLMRLGAGALRSPPPQQRTRSAEWVGRLFSPQ